MTRIGPARWPSRAVMMRVLVPASLAIYLAGMVLYVSHPLVGLLVVLPTLTISAATGLYGGAISGVLAIPVNNVFFITSGARTLAEFNFPAILATLAAAALVGYLRDLMNRSWRLSVELDLRNAEMAAD